MGFKMKDTIIKLDNVWKIYQMGNVKVNAVKDDKGAVKVELAVLPKSVIKKLQKEKEEEKKAKGEKEKKEVPEKIEDKVEKDEKTEKTKEIEKQELKE